ncbi:hypothetical protein [Acetonema longum]|uniref:Tetratricopeptide repeat-containing protein n=1 Tax=Acetonema longum DSM 6540 TaxID=1009370 RepID=F7NNR2_9FIRM|nr:hypothetical protein [Acetonema longum]EGO62246.1 tetratricopeptide repeat-containing protein [Acetonema longum DSM 6540]
MKVEYFKMYIRNLCKSGFHAMKALIYNNRISQRHYPDDKLLETVQLWGNGINLNEQMKYVYGIHRSGWNYAVSSLRKLHNPYAAFLDSFIEKTFSWDEKGSPPHEYDWIGVLHIPPMVPEWLPDHLQAQYFENIRKTEKWKVSEPHCKGFFTLSQYHANYMRRMVDVPVSVLYHPTEIPEAQWNIERFEMNQEKKIVQVGWWLRNMFGIYELPKSKYCKVFLKSRTESWFDELLKVEGEYRKKIGKLKDGMLDTVTTLSFLPNDQYDALLTENIVFINLYDTSANNAVIECMARGTPLLVNKLPAVIEYLGPEYPLYYETYNEAIEKAHDFQLLYAASQYLKQPERRTKLTRKFFLESFLSSEVYHSIN